MQRLINYIQNFITLSNTDIETIKDKIYIETLSPKSFIIKEGNICQRIGFIADGIIRSYYYDTKGNEITKGFHSENQFAIDLLSYQKNIPSTNFIQPVTNCEIIFIPKSSDEYLSKELDKWPILIRRISEALLSEKLEIKTILLHEDAKERYISFIKKNPKLANTVPLGYIASYLGIAQQSLSRIRKNLSL